MLTSNTPVHPGAAAPRRFTTEPIVALDVASMEEAVTLVSRLPRADFFKVGLQLFSAEGPDAVRWLKERGKRVFLDLKFHDIPNTVGGAVRSAAALSVDLLTVHASGGPAMLAAATEAARTAADPPKIFAVTILTSLDAPQLARSWGLASADPAEEAARLAALADEAGADGVVASLHEVTAIRQRTRDDLPVLTPGIRLPGDPAGDQWRIGSPADAARLNANFIVVGRAVTAAPDPAAAYDRILGELDGATGVTS
jgi:orotidine-5'-phosphate decarboxylase